MLVLPLLRNTLVPVVAVRPMRRSAPSGPHPSRTQTGVPVTYSYVYFWSRQGRKGQPCRVIARGKLNSCCVEFEDGYKMITSRNAIRRR